ncbi:MAG TPA: hypothetical protein VGJ17_10070 [Candidatus Limnocylindrales bacterium]
MTGPSAVAGRPAAERPRDAWRSLPAVQRTVGDPPVVAPAAPFAGALATRQPAGLALAPLGHEVSSLATPGLLIGVASSAQAAVSGRVDLPLQRHEVAPAPDQEQPWSSFDGPMETSGPGPARRAPDGELAPAPAAAIQHLAAPAPLLTSAATAEVRAAPPGRFDLRPGAAAAATSVASAPALPVVQRTAAVVTPDSNAPKAASQPAPAAAPARRPTLGEARRLGLGAPLRSASELNVQRSPATPPGSQPAVRQPVLAHVPGDATTASRDLVVGDGGGPAITVPDQLPAEPDTIAPLELTVVQPLSVERRASFPRLDLQRSIAVAGAEVGEPAAPLPATPGVTVSAASQAGPADPDLPVVARRAHETSGSVATLESSAPAGSPPRTAPVGGSPIRTTSSGWLLRQPAPDQAMPGRESGPAPAPSGGPVVARSLSDGARVHHGHLDNSHADRARTGAGSGHPMAAQLAALGITVQREPAGPVAPLRSAADGPAMEPGSSGTAGATVVPLQRAVEIGEMQVTSTAAGGQSGSASASSEASGSPAPGSRADRERELDELARRLYGRIRSRLASELLADRERAGLLVDLR